jgi:AraC-like DNA-binding protein
MNQHLINHGCGFKARQIGAFQIISKAVPAGARYAAHDHDTASISVLLFGAGIETRSRTVEIERVPGVIVANPAGEMHALRFADKSARSVVVEVDTQLLRSQTDASLTLAQPKIWRDQFSAVWALRLMRGLQFEDDLALEESILERIASLPSCKADTKHAPAWLQRAREQLQTSPHACVSIEALAAEAGVDSAHFAREFRRHFGTTASQYRLQAGLQQASLSLLQHKHSPSDAALVAGFADQSHFGRMLKRFSKLTPALAQRLCS